MEQLRGKFEGLHFFMMSIGEYSDYSVGGLYVSDKPITEEMWHAFCREESTIRDNHRKETCTKWGATYNSPEYEEHQQQWKNHYAWQQERGTYEEMFVKLHNLVPVEVTELHLDY